MPIKELIIFSISICSSYAVFVGIHTAFPTPMNALLLIGQHAMAVINAFAAFVVSVVGLELLAGIVYGFFQCMFKKKDECDGECESCEKCKE